MKRAFLYAVLGTWVTLLRVKRFFLPRGFKIVAIRRRCLKCHRRLRPTLVKNLHVGGVCSRCMGREARLRNAEIRGKLRRTVR